MDQNVTLLIVDDEVTFRLLLSTFFEQLGYEVLLAESGEKALKLMDENSANIGLVDLRLPGMDGIELCRTLKARNPVGIYFAMTGYTSLFELADTREAGFDDYFAKPLKLQELRVAVEQAVERLQRWRRKPTESLHE